MWELPYFRSVFRRFLSSKTRRTKWISRGRNKPLFGAQDLKSHQSWQSWCQIKWNWKQKSNFVLIEFNFLWKIIYQKAFWSLGWVDRTVLPDSLEITIFGTRSIQKSRWNSPPLTKTKTEKITLWNQATAQLIGKTQLSNHKQNFYLS